MPSIGRVIGAAEELREMFLRRFAAGCIPDDRHSVFPFFYLQVLRRRSVLLVREQDSLRVRLRGEASIR